MRKYLLLLAAAAFIAAPRAAHAGYTATLAPGTVSTPDTIGNNNIADLTEGFSITGGAFSAFTSDAGPGDPVLNNADLANYTYDLIGSVSNVAGNVVTYTGSYAINYAGFGGNPVSAGSFTIDAVFTSPLSATLSGTLLESSASGPPFADLGNYASVTFAGTFAPDASNVAGGAGNFGILNGTITANGNAIPEPGSMALLATGLLPMAGMLRRRRKA